MNACSCGGDGRPAIASAIVAGSCGAGCGDPGASRPDACRDVAARGDLPEAAVREDALAALRMRLARSGWRFGEADGRPVVLVNPLLVPRPADVSAEAEDPTADAAAGELLALLTIGGSLMQARLRARAVAIGRMLHARGGWPLMAAAFARVHAAAGPYGLVVSYVWDGVGDWRC